MDGEQVATWTSTEPAHVVTYVLPEGSHTLELAAMDETGSVGRIVTTVVVTADAQPGPPAPGMAIVPYILPILVGFSKIG